MTPFAESAPPPTTGALFVDPTTPLGPSVHNFVASTPESGPPAEKSALGDAGVDSAMSTLFQGAPHRSEAGSHMMRSADASALQPAYLNSPLSTSACWAGDAASRPVQVDAVHPQPPASHREVAFPPSICATSSNPNRHVALTEPRGWKKELMDVLDAHAVGVGVGVVAHVHASEPDTGCGA